VSTVSSETEPKRPKGDLPWRVGSALGRTLYDVDGEFVGLMDSPELAQQVVDAVNARDPSK
jgi:hypothetical protein